MSRNEEDFWRMMEDRAIKGEELIKQGHFPNCFKVHYPDEADSYCTCEEISLMDNRRGVDNEEVPS